MCGITDLQGCAEDIAQAASQGFLDTLAAAFTAEFDVAMDMMTAWVFPPSVNIEATQIDLVRQWQLPLAFLITFAGLIWQAIQMAVTARGEPLLQAMKGLFAVAAWGGIGIIGTRYALQMGDAWSTWILAQTKAVSHDGFGFGDMTVAMAQLHPLSRMIISLGVMVMVYTQVIIMVFREGSILVLAPQLQLAASGKVTRGTSAWLDKLLGWMLALVAYKPVAATIIGVGGMLVRTEPSNNDPRPVFMGLAIMAMSIVALPAMMRFFNWMTASISSGHGMQNRARMGIADMHYGMAAAKGLGNALGGNSAAAHSSFLSSALPAAGTAPGAAAASGAGGAAAGAGAAGAASGVAAAAGPAAIVVMVGVKAGQMAVGKSKELMDRGMTGK